MNRRTPTNFWNRLPHLFKSRAKRQRAFSLVEVAMAVGIVGFGMTVILGCLPVGLLSVKDSKIQSAKANIARQLRGELQQIAFYTDGKKTTIDDLSTESKFYNQDGTPAEDADSAYFLAKFAVEEKSTINGTSFAPPSARSVKVLLTYPLAAPEANREESSFALFLARQLGI